MTLNRPKPMSVAELRAHQAAKSGSRPVATTTPHVQPTGNLYPSIRPVWWIGLDPGVETGFALWQARKGGTPGRFLEVTSLPFVATIRRLEKLAREFGPASLRVRVENPRGNRPTFDKGVAATLENIKVRENMSQKVGSNKRDAQLLMDFLTDLGIPFDAVVPTGNGKKGKIEAAFFAGVLGFPGRTNQHGRDAAKMVLGL